MTAPLPIAEQINEVLRELAERETRYPLRIEERRMSQAQAGRQNQVMEAVLKTLRWLERNETQIKQALKGREP